MPLVLVSAPPGFGKTTATAAAVRKLQAGGDARLAWLSLEEADDEPARFWRYFAAGLQAATGLGADLLSAVEAPQLPPIPPLLAALLNALAEAPEHLAYVLDDAHVLTQPDIVEGLAFLLDHAPRSLHLILVTRADPPLHRLRARGQLVEVRAVDLRFSPAEAAGLLIGGMALPLTGDEVTRLADQTEGWAAGLYLAGLALQADPEAPARQDLLGRLAHTNRYILDYLTEEVLARQPAAVQSFLLQTSILDRMCAPLCDAILQKDEGGRSPAGMLRNAQPAPGVKDEGGSESDSDSCQGHASQSFSPHPSSLPPSQEILETLARRNLFVTPLGPLSPGGPAWYRYHPLFATLLTGHLRQRSPGLVPALHSRAAAWFESAGEAEWAVEHAFAGEDFPRAARLIDTHAGRMVMEGRILTVERWLRRLPEAQARLLPGANLAFAWALVLRGQYGAAEPHVDQAQAAMDPEDTALQAEVHALRAGLADVQGRPDEALAHARQAVAQVPADRAFVRAMAQFMLAGALRESGDIEAAAAAYETAIPLCRAAGLPLPEMVSRAHLGSLSILQGRLRRAEAVTRPVAAAGVQHPAAGAAYSSLADVLIEWNRLPEAAELVDRALALARATGHTAAIVRIHIQRARLVRAQGDFAAARAGIEEATALAGQGVPAWIEPLLLAEQVHLWLDQGETSMAARLLSQRGSDASRAASHTVDALPLAEARLLLEQGEYDRAWERLGAVLAQAQTGGRQGSVIQALVLRAMVQDSQGQARAAEEDLRHAERLARPEGYTRLFLEAGPRLAALRNRLAVRGAIPGSFDDVEPLTEREVEVLRLMAEGLTYQQIADRLVISVNTVRHHVKGIYGKLQTGTRTQALQAARERNLL